MSEHLSKFEAEAYVRGTLPPDKLLQLDDHIVSCTVCRKALAAERRAGESGLLATLAQPDYDPHLSFNQLSEYVDHQLNEVDQEIAEHHLNFCDPCRVQVRDLEILRTEIAVVAEPAVLAVGSTTRFWDRFGRARFPAFAIPATAVLIAAILFAGWFIANRGTEIETSAVKAPDGDFPIGAPPTTLDTPAETDINQNSAADIPKPVVSLNDGRGRIEIDAAGKVSGLGDSRYDPLVAAALTGKGIEIAAELRQLRQSSGELMGGGQKTGVPFALTAPVGAIVETVQPRLRWRSLKGADSYRVDIFDEGFIKVASSPLIKGTEWHANVALRRGVVYRWQVTATANGEEIKSPVRPAPDAKFKVLDTGIARKLDDARAKHGQSHLLLGLLYAEAGLLDDATREFRILVQKNPDSPIARRLLEKVRSAR
ncbi:MAG: zf-HC2 domain-containing protein [Pyrinomonadaceae bacterium]